MSAPHTRDQHRHGLVASPDTSQNAVQITGELGKIKISLLYLSTTDLRNAKNSCQLLDGRISYCTERHTFAALVEREPQR